MNYFVTIGIEIHCELKTNTKMFSGAPVRFGEIANTYPFVPIGWNCCVIWNPFGKSE